MPRKTAKKNIKLAEEITTDTQEQINTEELASQDSGPTNNEIIDVAWQHVQPIFDFKQRLEEMEDYFGQMCLRFEKNKANIMSQIIYGQNDLYGMAESLQKELNIDSSITYELKLPTNPGEKGFFVRKDD